MSQNRVSPGFVLLSQDSIENSLGLLGLYSPTILKNGLSFALRIFLYLVAFECSTTSDWLNGVATYRKVWRIRERTFSRIIGEYGLCISKRLENIVEK